MSWIERAKVGDKVVCVNDKNSRELRIGCVYTISDFRMVEGMTALGTVEVGIQLSEVRSRSKYNFFAVSRFRPAKSTDKGMQILRDLLITQTVKENT